jgi:hypothetical protein
MIYPRITGFDCYTNEVIDREMTEQEYAELIASGWTMEATDETPSPD